MNSRARAQGQPWTMCPAARTYRNTDGHQAQNWPRWATRSPLDDGFAVAYNVHTVPITSMTVKAL